MATDNERASCKRKKRYSSDASTQAALRLINPFKKQNKPYRVYKCRVCNGWHLTSQPKAKFKNVGVHGPY